MFSVVNTRSKILFAVVVGVAVILSFRGGILDAATNAAALVVPSLVAGDTVATIIYHRQRLKLVEDPVRVKKSTMVGIISRSSFFYCVHFLQLV